MFTPRTHLPIAVGLALIVTACSTEPDADKDPTDTDVDGTTETYGPLVDTQEASEDDCAGGGVTIRTGIDDGANEGVAGDGVLQDGEVLTEQTVCGAPPPAPGGTVGYLPTDDAPEGPAGSAKIMLNGGTGTGYGGEGGNIYWSEGQSARYGHIKHYTTGEADTAFTTPPQTVYLGNTPHTFTDDTVVPAVFATGSLNTGDVFTYNGTGPLYRKTSDGEEVLTGIKINEGVTVRIEPGDNLAGLVPVATGDVEFNLESGVLILGTLTTGTNNRTKADLEIESPVVWIGANGAIDLGGANRMGENPATTGRNLAIEAAVYNEVLNRDVGIIVNEGVIDVSGGNGQAPQSGRSISLYAGSAVYSTGTLRAKGGNSTTTVSSASGGSVSIYAEYGPAYLGGTVNISAGNGGHGNANAGSFNLSADLLKSSAAILATGSSPDNASCVSVPCNGGQAGSLSFNVDGAMFIGGTINIDGGDGAGPGSYAGRGGYLYMNQYPRDTTLGSSEGAGPFELSADISGNGGGGAEYGADAGSINIYTDATFDPFSEKRLLGYSSFELNGGNGPQEAGEGGRWTTYRSSSYDGSTSGPCGGIINEVPINAMGGNATADSAYGGEGGRIEWFARSYTSGDNSGEVVINRAPLMLNAGDGGRAYFGGFAHFDGSGGVTNTGNITANGGEATGTSSYGGPGYGDDAIRFRASSGPVTNSGNLSAAGGPGVYEGGEGGTILLAGTSVKSTGNLDVSGANGGEEGGNGGDIVFQADIGTASNEGSACAVQGGTGSTSDGEDGSIFVGGINQTGSCLN